MAKRIKLHPETPHRKRIFEIADEVRRGALLLIPTDSRYALACSYENKKGIKRIRKIRNMGKEDHLTLLCDSLGGVAKFAHISDFHFRLIKRLIPGPFTFILPATKEVPKLLVHPNKKTIGIRVPDYPINALLVKEVKHPLLAISAKKDHLGDREILKLDRESFLREFEKVVDLIIDNQQELPSHESTVIDMTGIDVSIIREGLDVDTARQVIAGHGKIPVGVRL